MKNVMAVILAGGKGSRLEPLTRDRAKPAVPFGGDYRIVDFALSNCLNSGLRKLLLLTQYKAISLDRHINDGWASFSVANWVNLLMLYLLNSGLMSIGIGEPRMPSIKISTHWRKNDRNTF